MTIGEKLIELRKKSGNTQEKIANKLNISRQTLSNWESDITSPDLESAFKIAKIYNVTLDDLTNNKVEIECKNTILYSLINKTIYLELTDDDFIFNKPVKVIDLNDSFIKIEYTDKKNTFIKLLDINLICSIREEEDL